MSASIAMPMPRHRPWAPSRHGVLPRPRPRTLAWAVLGVVVIAVWTVTIRPVSLGGPTAYVLVRGVSMEPDLHGGDLVITHTRSTYGLGTVIAYRVPADEFPAGATVIHRIVGGDGVSGYVTKGDNQSSIDDWHPTDANVIGEVWAQVSRLGLLLASLRSPLLLASIGAGVAVAILLVPPAHPAYVGHHRPGRHRRTGRLEAILRPKGS